jgi:hypothetical protein
MCVSIYAQPWPEGGDLHASEEEGSEEVDQEVLEEEEVGPF